MLEILEHFESAMSGAEKLSPVVLIGLGVAAVVAGLFVWLGGLSFKRLLAAIAGAIGGGLVASCAIGLSAAPAAASAVAAALVAIAFEKVFITALAAGLATAIGIMFFMGPYIEAASPAKVESRADGPEQVMALSAGQSMRKLGAWMVETGRQIRRACSETQAHKWALSVALGLIVAAAGSFLWRPTAALYFSTAGTMLVFAGMILLLFSKGAMPVNRICRRPSAYASVFAAMVIFGTAEQLLLCRAAKTPSASEEAGRNKKAGK